MAVVSYLIRALPPTLIQRQIKSTFIKSFLYYVPYVTLAVMTFPAIIEATESPISGAVALLAGIIAAWFGASLIKVAAVCCGAVLIIELFLPLKQNRRSFLRQKGNVRRFKIFQKVNITLDN